MLRVNAETTGRGYDNEPYDEGIMDEDDADADDDDEHPGQLVVVTQKMKQGICSICDGITT